jgi:ABC-2 type transport system ATP-binding protein
VITASSLTRRFGERVAVEDLTLDIRAGEIFALLGPNGAGKTTTLRMLAALIAPTAGRIVVDGTELTAATAGAVRSRIGLLTETPGLWDRLSVRTNLLVYARLHQIPRPADVVDAALQRFELRDRRDDAAASLSKGMRQKVALARALLHQPAIVLLDEPTSGLDPAMARSVRELILQLRAERRAVLICTHNLDEAERLADRVAVLQRRILALDTPDRLRRNLYGHRVRVVLAVDAEPFASVASRVGSAARIEGSTLSVVLQRPDEDTPRLVRALVEAGAPVREVTEERPPLEEVYLRIVEKQAGS